MGSTPGSDPRGPRPPPELVKFKFRHLVDKPEFLLER